MIQMADAQGASGGARGDDRPPPRDPKKGKAPAGPKKKKKKVKKGNSDNETTLAVDRAKRVIERGGRGSYFELLTMQGHQLLQRVLSLSRAILAG